MIKVRANFFIVRSAVAVGRHSGLQCPHPNLKFIPSRLYSYAFLVQKNTKEITVLGALAIKRNCPSLRSIEVDKLRDSETCEKLTEDGLIYLLHLPRLSLIEIHNPSGSDWFYR